MPQQSKIYADIIASEVSLVDYLSPSLTIFINGQPLQQLLSTATGDKSMLGLISPWTGCLEDSKAQSIVDYRMDPRVAGSGRVPVLVCSDDLDFSCTVIIADVFVEKDIVRWKQLGIDGTRSSNAEDVAQTVDRITGIDELHFPRALYEKCVDDFMQYRSRSQ